MLTTTLVVAEAYALVRRRAGYQAAMRVLDLLEASPHVTRVPVDRGLEQAAEQILRQYREQEFSYADAVSVAVMRRLGITDAFAFDRHFATAGFTRVPAV
jgi:uncharacterized protein